MNYALHRARPQWAKVDMFEHASRLYIVPFCTCVRHCVVILSQFVNVRVVLEYINGQSQRADCSCTMHAVGIPIVDGECGVCAWLVDALHSAYKCEPCGRVYIMF